MDITPRHIEQIEALNRHGSFRRAAEKLCISQPALSRSILVLEETLGVKFFDRAQGKLVLTPYGRIVLDRGESILKEMQLLHRDIHMLQGGEQGVLNIGCGPIPAETLAGDAIARFNNLFPQVTIKLVIDHAPGLERLLRNRSIDFYVAEVSQLANKENYDLVPMQQQQGYFCCRKGHPLTARASLAVSDILQFPMALMWLSDRIYTLLSNLSGRDIQKSEDLGVGFIECNNMNILLCVVSGTDAVSMTSREILSKSIYKERIVLLPLEIPDLKTGYHIVSLRNYLSIPAISHLKGFFLESAAQRVQQA